MTPAVLLVAAASAQDYRFPTTDSHVGYFYPTAYVDQGGMDWACGDNTYDDHGGSDFGVGSWTGMDAGRDVVAAAPGVAITAHDGEYDRCDYLGCGSGYGNYVVLLHPDGKKTYYGHLKNGSVAVSVGQYVSCGDALGEVGSSGNSTGPHLHFEVRGLADDSQDPFDGDCSAPPSYWVDQGAYGGTPATSCDTDIATCPDLDLLTCGAVVSGSNTDSGSTDVHGWYGCSEWRYSGNEVGWSFVTDLDETVTVHLDGLGADLDVYVLDSDACQGSDCLAYSDAGDADSESTSFSATAGHTYSVVVDGYDGAASAYTLSIDCAGGLPDQGDDSGTDDTGTHDTGDGDADGGSSTDTGGPLSDTDPDRAGGPPGALTHMETAGCSCGPGGPAGGAGWLGLLGLVGLVRRRVPRPQPAGCSTPLTRRPRT